MLVGLVSVLLMVACQQKNPSAPPKETIHPQVDIPWPSLANSPWPAAHGSIQCTGRSKYRGPREGKVCWTFSEEKFRNEISGVVIGEDSTIYFSAKREFSQDYNRYLYALNPDGSLKWKAKIEAIQASTPMIGAGDVIYLPAAGGPFYAFNSDGTVRWKYDTSSLLYTFSTALGLDGTIYFSDTDGMLYALFPNGSLKWSTKGNAGLYSDASNFSIAISPDGTVLYLAGLDTTINAINAQTGTVLWQLPTEHKLITAPLVDCDGNVYFIKKDTIGFVIFSVTSTGAFRWKSAVSVDPYISLHMDKDGNIYAYGRKNELLSFDYSGNLRWSIVMLEVDISTSPGSIRGDGEGMIYFAYSYRYIVAIDQSGNNQFVCELPDLSDGLIMGALSSDGHLYVSGAYQFFCIK
jgi:outer membrane protein assembly factor BamB